jgi:glycosyltransferase involved in cell wall biosynthesis
MHILFLTHYFPPEVNAPAARTHENARRWVKAGHKVTVITCAPNHPSGIVYHGYENKWCQWDEKDGVKVLRVKTYLSPNKGVGNRSLNYLSYLFSAIVFCRLVKHVDLVVSTSPQFFCGLSGYFVSRLHRCPWVVEIRDLWPESIHAVGAVRAGGVIRLLELIELFLYRKPNHIIALTTAFKRHIVNKGIPPEKIDIVTNGADLEQFSPLPKENGFRETHDLKGKFITSYAGTFGMAHALETVLKAAEILKSYPQIKFMLVGDGAERETLIRRKREMGLENVLMLPQQRKEVIPGILAASDVCMVLLRKTELFKTVIPSKIFEAMAMERPIILGVDGESREIVEGSGSGIFIEPEDAKQLAQTVLEMSRNTAWAENLGKAGGEFVRKHYSRDKLAMEYLDVLKTVAGSEVCAD